VIDLGEIAARVATDLQGQAASKRVFVRVAGAGLASAQAEELLSYSMLANLVKNAIEAAPEDTEVAIELEREGDWAYVRVKNQGLVPESVRGRFFQKYTTAGKSAGVGLGAYSARLLARVQGGELTLDNQTGSATDPHGAAARRRPRPSQGQARHRPQAHRPHRSARASRRCAWCWRTTTSSTASC
jgi:signal transduction histidine kinase